MRVGYITMVLTTAMIAHAVPPWAQNSFQETDEYLLLACDGIGPSAASATKNCHTNCRAAASEVLIKDVSFNHLLIQSENDTAIFDKVEIDFEVMGLICRPQRESIEEKDGLFEAWILCRFNKRNTILQEQSAQTKTSRLTQVTDSNAIISKDMRRMLVSTVPSCESILIVNKTGGRIHRCTENPSTLFLAKDEVRLIVRQIGYRPQEVLLKGGPDDGNIQVYLSSF